MTSPQLPERVQRVLSALTPRELELIVDVAIAGHELGWKSGGERGWSRTYPEMVAEVIERCLTQPGRFPAVGNLGRPL